jgi:pilus assembly protein CpaB
MNKQRGWLLLSLGVLLAVGTGVAVFYLLRQQQQAALADARAIAEAQVAPVATLQLPVAARPLTPGTMITAEDFQLREFPVDLVPQAAITNTVALENQVLAEPVGEGETFSTLQLAGANAARVSSQLPAGQVIYAFPINDLLTQLSVVEPGDRIDLLITLPIASADASSAVQVTAFTVQNILVFDVVRPIVAEDEEGAPVALLLSLSPEDAALVKHVRDSEASIDFVLRSVLDTEPFEVTPIDREDLIARYGLR